MALVDFEIQGHIAVITLNRPEARNAINPEVAVRLADAWESVRDDDQVRVAILTGTGGTFCSGADLKAIAAGDGNRVEAEGEDGPLGPTRLQLGKPVIAAIEGHAVAGGLELLLSTDIRAAAPHARFGLPEVKWGIYPFGGATLKLNRQIVHSYAISRTKNKRAVMHGSFLGR